MNQSISRAIQRWGSIKLKDIVQIIQFTMISFDFLLHHINVTDIKTTTTKKNNKNISLKPYYGTVCS